MRCFLPKHFYSTSQAILNLSWPVPPAETVNTLADPCHKKADFVLKRRFRFILHTCPCEGLCSWTPSADAVWLRTPVEKLLNSLYDYFTS